jgi:iron(III) transport system permease protein
MVSASMAVPFYKTFWKVTVPVCLPAVLEIGFYYFVNSMATVSAVIFLYSPDIKLASVAVMNMDDAGDTAAAAAMCFLIMSTNILTRVLYDFASRRLLLRSQAWRRKFNG